MQCFSQTKLGSMSDDVGLETRWARQPHARLLPEGLISLLDALNAVIHVLRRCLARGGCVAASISHRIISCFSVT
jgi:hypothetical protein